MGAIVLIGLATLLSACGGKARTATQPSSPQGSETPCPLVSDADIAKLNPVLKRADDDWESHDGSVFCGISFGVNLDDLVHSGVNAKPLPFEFLEVSVLRTADLLPNDRLTKDLCEPLIKGCYSIAGVGDFAFFIKKNAGRTAAPISYEGIRAASGSYEIRVIANYWKGGDPGPGAIALAKKLAQQYR